MSVIKSIGNFFGFIAGGIVAIIVGSFMIRGTMHMWDSDESTSSKHNKKQKNGEKTNESDNEENRKDN